MLNPTALNLLYMPSRRPSSTVVRACGRAHHLRCSAAPGAAQLCRRLAPPRRHHPENRGTGVARTLATNARHSRTPTHVRPADPSRLAPPRPGVQSPVARPQPRPRRGPLGSHVAPVLKGSLYSIYSIPCSVATAPAPTSASRRTSAFVASDSAHSSSHCGDHGQKKRD